MLDLFTVLAVLARAPRLAGSVLFCALVAGSAGCSEEACIQKASAKGGVCPSRADAAQVIAGACGFLATQQDGFIQSVDSEPTDDGTLCCYAVTKTTSLNVSCVRPASSTAAGP